MHQVLTALRGDDPQLPSPSNKANQFVLRVGELCPGLSALKSEKEQVSIRVSSAEQTLRGSSLVLNGLRHQSRTEDLCSKMLGLNFPGEIWGFLQASHLRQSNLQQEDQTLNLVRSG